MIYLLLTGFNLLSSYINLLISKKDTRYALIFNIPLFIYCFYVNANIYLNEQMNCNKSVESYIGYYARKYNSLTDSIDMLSLMSVGYILIIQKIGEYVYENYYWLAMIINKYTIIKINENGIKLVWPKNYENMKRIYKKSRGLRIYFKTLYLMLRIIFGIYGLICYLFYYLMEPECSEKYNIYSDIVIYYSVINGMSTTMKMIIIMKRIICRNGKIIAKNMYVSIDGVYREIREHNRKEKKD